MLNTIRIVLGSIMLLIALATLWMIIVFSQGKIWLYFSNLKAFFDLVIMLILPAASAWLLLAPKNQKQALTGLGIFVFLVAFFFIDQIL